jgi:hypothetical protein
MFCLGYGIGCISVTPVVRKLEQKPWLRKIRKAPFEAARAHGGKLHKLRPPMKHGFPISKLDKKVGGL